MGNWRAPSKGLPLFLGLADAACGNEGTQLLPNPDFLKECCNLDFFKKIPTFKDADSLLFLTVLWPNKVSLWVKLVSQFVNSDLYT